MLKTKKSTVILITVTVILIAAAIITALIGGGVLDIFKPDGTYVNLYFLDTQKTKPVAEQRLLPPDYDPMDLRTLVALLIEGPKNTIDYAPAIPSGTRLISVYRENNLAVVNFSSEFKTDSPANDILAATTVINTLCDTAVINQVKILIEGTELIDNSKLSSSFISKDDIIYGNANTNQESVILSLYYPAIDGNGLLVEKRTISPKDKEPLVQVAMNELLKGTENPNASNIIPSTAKLLSTELNDKICFVNLSTEFIDNHTAGSSAELMAIYSIVNTLTELEDVNKVQFLIEGKKAELFGEIMFSEPFERDESYIKQ